MQVYDIIFYNLGIETIHSYERVIREEESLDQAINEAVELCSYDASWPDLFEIERDYLLSLGEEKFIDIQHFGSTAVPGLAAKPIIDILIGITTLSEADPIVARLCQITRYTTSAEFNATLSDRRWLMKYANGRRTHHLHLVKYDGKQWLYRLKFRDELRSNELLIIRKTKSAKKHPSNLKKILQNHYEKRGQKKPL